MKYLQTTLAAACAVVMAGCGFMPEYSTGFRNGEIQKASYKGWWYKSYEAELVLSGLKYGSTNVGYTNVFAFSATDPAIIKELERLAGRRAIIHYKQWAIAPWTQETSYTVYKVEEVK